MKLSKQITELEGLLAKATPGDIRVNRAHDLWVELARGNGVHRRMVADCLEESDANLFVAALNTLPALIARINKLEWALKCVRDREDSPETVRIAEEALKEDV